MKPEVSIGMGLGVGALVGALFTHAMPSLIDHRVGDPEDANANSALRTATWTGGALVTVTALLAKDATVFVIGGSVLVGLNLWHRHANLVNPMTGRAMAPTVTRPDEMNQLSPDMAYAGEE